MADTLTITTSDSTLTYTGTTSINFFFQIEDNVRTNNQTSDTQGFLTKKQINRRRVEARITIGDDRANINASLLPIEMYPTPIDVTIDRNWVGSSTTVKRFEMYELRKNRDLDGTAEEWSFRLVEVIGA